MQTYCIKVLFGFTFSFLITTYLLPFIIKVAKKFNILDVPDGVVKKHKNPTPYLGGIALYVGFLASLGFVFPFENHMLLFFIGTTLLLFVGIIDDLVVLKPYQKFFGQIISSFFFLKSGFLLKSDFFFCYPILIPFSIIWILTVINAFNLIDVMDGLATTVAIFAAGAFLVISLLWQEHSNAILLSSFLGALIGFLPYNCPPAKIYLGDTGSLFIGGFLSTVPFFFSWGLRAKYAFLSPVIILAIPLLEVASLIIIRTLKKIPFYRASPDHFSLYLLRAGWSKKSILIYVAVLSIFLDLNSVLFVENKFTILCVSFFGILFLFNWILIFATKYSFKNNQ